MAYLHTLRIEAERLGVEFRPDTPVDRVLVENDAVTGVETPYGTISASSVVCAAGLQTRPLLREHVALPLRPFTWNVLILDLGRDVRDSHPIGVEADYGIYWRPTPEGYLLIGAEHALEADQEPSMDEAFRSVMQREVPSLLADVDTARIVREEYCHAPDSTTPDTRAIIDAPDEGPDGLVIAAGFHGIGVMTAPATAAAIRSILTDRSTELPLAPFRLDRFSTRSSSFPFVSIYDEHF